jgi:hypothetical protein
MVKVGPSGDRGGASTFCLWTIEGLEHEALGSASGPQVVDEDVTDANASRHGIDLAVRGKKNPFNSSHTSN